MSRLFRSYPLLLAGLALLLLFEGRSPGQATERVRLPRDRQTILLLQAARNALQESSWLQALEALHQLLLRPDCLIEAPDLQRIRGLTPPARLVGVHSEALRLLREMPEEGQTFRELYWGPVAEARLDEARKAKDSAGLLAVARQYPTTRAAGKALEELARLEEQQGRTGEAALALQQLKRLEPVAGWSAERRQFAERIFKNSERGTRSAEQKTVPRSQLRTPSLAEPLWVKPLGVSARSIRWVREAAVTLDKRGQPVPVAGPPLVLANPRPGEPPLVVYRSRLGVQVVKIDSGDLVWRSASAWSLDGMIGKPEKADAIENWVSDYLETMERPAVLFENSTVGTLSADSKQVYAIEDLAVVPTIEMAGRLLLNMDNVTSMNPLDAVQHNRLHAHDLLTGKYRWQLGGRGPEAGELADSFFLGPPLPVEDRLYVLNEKEREVRLLSLNPADGKVLSVQPLVQTGKLLLEEPIRRMRAAHLTLGEGVLVCPTNAGAVLAVDVLTGSLLWAHLPELARSASEGDFWNEPPIVVAGKVILALPEAPFIECLDLHNGSRLWRVQRQEDDVALGGVADGKILVVGKKSCRALSLSKGETLWSVSTGMPSGQGLIAAGRLYLPLRRGATSGRPEVCVVNLAGGKVEARLRSRREQAPGTLILGPDVVLSLTPMDLTAYPWSVGQ